MKNKSLKSKSFVGRKQADSDNDWSMPGSRQLQVMDRISKGFESKNYRKIKLDRAL